jgi:hypothetical protein
MMVVRLRLKLHVGVSLKKREIELFLQSSQRINFLLTSGSLLHRTALVV